MPNLLLGILVGGGVAFGLGHLLANAFAGSGWKQKAQESRRFAQLASGIIEPIWGAFRRENNSAIRARTLADLNSP